MPTQANETASSDGQSFEAVLDSNNRDDGSWTPTKYGGDDGSWTPTKYGGDDGSWTPTKYGGDDGSWTPTKYDGLTGTPSIPPAVVVGHEGIDSPPAPVAGQDPIEPRENIDNSEPSNTFHNGSIPRIAVIEKGFDSGGHGDLVTDVLSKQLEKDSYHIDKFDLTKTAIGNGLFGDVLERTKETGKKYDYVNVSSVLIESFGPNSLAPSLLGESYNDPSEIDRVLTSGNDDEKRALREALIRLSEDSPKNLSTKLKQLNGGKPPSKEGLRETLSLMRVGIILSDGMKLMDMGTNIFTGAGNSPEQARANFLTLLSIGDERTNEDNGRHVNVGSLENSTENSTLSRSKNYTLKETQETPLLGTEGASGKFADIFAAGRTDNDNPSLVEWGTSFSSPEAIVNDISRRQRVPSIGQGGFRPAPQPAPSALANQRPEAAIRNSDLGAKTPDRATSQSEIVTKTEDNPPSTEKSNMRNINLELSKIQDEYNRINSPSIKGILDKYVNTLRDGLLSQETDSARVDFLQEQKNTAQEARRIIAEMSITPELKLDFGILSAAFEEVIVVIDKQMSEYAETFTDFTS